MEAARRVVDFPTLWVAADWVTQHCVVPDGFEKGLPFVPSDWQLWALLNFYRVKLDARPAWWPKERQPQFGTAFFYRRAQIVLPQKAGKAPYTAAHVCVEAVGPALFAGWAKEGDVWECAQWGCGCGWVYRYRPGEPMGMPWPTPLIQITATSEDQTDNIYGALRPMIDEGPLSELIPKTGEEFIRLPNGGRIDTVTSNARSRLGQRVTFVPQDETGLWTPQSGMVKVAETQRRGAAGMGGRVEETTNSWNPAEDSVAQRTAESKRPDIFRLHPLPPARLNYGNKRDRRRIHQIVYADCPWVDLDAIEAEAAELLEKDPVQAERFFGNRVVPGAGHAFNGDRWRELADPTIVVPDRALITIGVDGARFDDALAIIATDVAGGHQWPIGIWEVPDDAPPDYEHPVEEVDRMMLATFDRWRVWRVYVDPQYIEDLFSRWQGRWGQRRVVPWFTYRQRQVAYAVRAFRDAIAAGDVTNDGDSVFDRHIRQATKHPVNVRDDDGRRMWSIGKDTPMSPRKMDAAMAAVISWEARSDAIASGALKKKRSGAWGL